MRQITHLTARAAGFLDPWGGEPQLREVMDLAMFISAQIRAWKELAGGVQARRYNG
jgi:hypothetical protein